MSFDVRTVTPDEFDEYLEVTSGSFLDRPDIGRMADAVRGRWEPSRTWAAVDDGRICGTFRSWATELTVPGGAQLPASAVAGVGVRPTHRRRGVLTRLAAAEHAAIRDRGEAVGLLYASEWPIYGRFGYGAGCRVAAWTLDARATSFHGDPVSGVDLVAPDAAAALLVKGVFDTWRARQPGEIRRRDFGWEEDLGVVESPWSHRWKGFLAFHRGPAGDVDGYARYTAEEKWEARQPRSILKVDELHALTDDAYRALWRFLAEVDLVATVQAGGRSPAERLPWILTNARAAVPGDIGDGLWVRLFDLPRALASRAWEREGRIVLEVVDPELAAPVTLALDASPDGATCTATGRSPDLTLHVAALGAAYLGGARLRDATIATGVDEHREGALALADSLLRTADEPWCSTFF